MIRGTITRLLFHHTISYLFSQFAKAFWISALGKRIIIFHPFLTISSNNADTSTKVDQGANQCLGFFDFFRR